MNEGFAFFAIVTWQLNHSGHMVNPDYFIDMSDWEVEVNEAGIIALVDGINAFYGNEENMGTILDEETLVDIGYDTGVLEAR